ncbi:MAG: baseplate J/gp47 family protein [Salinisphaera sp.]|jgi:uncharacterized phage protein gp47/JayE|nr:baseplate J/gp47 family protein [Salinisphaera sp.]
MALTRPSLSDLRTRAISDLQAALRLSGNLGAYLGALAYVVAGACHGLYGYIENIGGQMNPATAAGVFLDRWAGLWKVYRKLAAAAAGDVTLNGTAGTVVASGVLMQSGTGVMYRTTAGGTIASGGTLVVAAVATTTGTDSNRLGFETLQLVSPAAGVNSSAAVAAGGLTGGRDEETDDELRARLILRISNPPHGGNAADYELWALEVSGITRAWCVPRYNGDGSVRVYVGEANPTGTTLAGSALVADALAHIQSVKPVSYSDLSVIAPTINAQAHQIHLVPNTVDVQNAVIAELDALYTRDAAPEGKVYLSRINEAISIAAGESDHTLVSPTADPTAAAGEILTRGAVSFV